MKYLLTAIWALVCIGVLAFSHISWNKQTTVQAVKSEHDKKVDQENNTANNYEEYLKMAGNWPETAKDQFLLSMKAGNPFKILFVGSGALQWGNVVSQGLTESFGSKRISTSLHTFDSTSDDFIAGNKQLEIAAEKAQLVVIEPFLLNDNGTTTIDVTLANLTKIMDDIKAESPETTFILQPSYPFYLPNYYSIQVKALKEYATLNNLTYLDHWSAWPATDNPQINDYVTQSGPNAEGLNVWANYLVEYFVKK
ncbi:hypothetical protein F4694_002678 [Bacillus niacini]|uniref:SGNH/GDSL hydrolase family protein n=1 Tax=Neobacillus niacini TaxID=86668 RepID=A0A852TAV9_9BACI|nr:SGNH/GDSL hydrolase family protein [Neobacillus niacini]NYE05903.1 hypothetical protein [Neobacillus niacini]